MANGKFASTGVVVGQTRRDRFQQAAENRASNSVTMGNNVPRQAEGKVGDITAREVSGIGLRCYIKTNSGWYDINTMRSAEQTQWIPMVLVNNWQTDTTFEGEIAKYFKDTNGFVHLRGKVQQSSGTVTETICTLPPGFRPAGQIWRWIVKSTNPTSTTQLGVIKILSTGEISTHSAGSGSASLMDLEGISFYSGQTIVGTGAGSGGGGSGGGGGAGSGGSRSGG